MKKINCFTDFLPYNLEKEIHQCRMFTEFVKSKRKLCCNIGFRILLLPKFQIHDKANYMERIF